MFYEEKFLLHYYIKYPNHFNILISILILLYTHYEKVVYVEHFQCYHYFTFNYFFPIQFNIVFI